MGGKQGLGKETKSALYTVSTVTAKFALKGTQIFADFEQRIFYVQ